MTWHVRAESRCCAPAAANLNAPSHTASCGSCSRLWLAALATEPRAALLGGAARAAAPLFDLALGGARRAEEEEAGFEALHGLFWLTVNVADSAPVLISVDDLQWCDRMSLRFLVYLARRLEGLPLLLAGSLRTGQPDVDAGTLAELESEPHVTLRPAPLSPSAVRELLDTALASDPAAEFVGAVHTACGGNPLLVGELVQAVRAEGIEPTASGAARVADLGPERLVRSVAWRVRRVGASAEAVARAVAVLGDDCELSLAAEPRRDRHRGSRRCGRRPCPDRDSLRPRTARVRASGAARRGPRRPQRRRADRPLTGARPSS